MSIFDPSNDPAWFGTGSDIVLLSSKVKSYFRGKFSEHCQTCNEWVIQFTIYFITLLLIFIKSKAIQWETVKYQYK